MEADKLLSEPIVLRDISHSINEAVIRAYRDGYQAALVAVNNAALDYDSPDYGAVVKASTEARGRLETALTAALDGDRIYW